MAGVGAALAGGAILVEVIVAIGLSTGGSLSRLGARSRARSARRRRSATLFLTDHLIAFEVTSIVLLVAAVGGVVLGSHARAQRGAPPSRVEEARRGGGRCTGLTITWYLALAGDPVRRPARSACSSAAAR